MKMYDENEIEIIDVYLTKENFPKCYANKKKELIEIAGMTDDEAETWLLKNPISLELYYQYDQGLFGLECEALGNGSGFMSPYNGEEIEQVDNEF